MQRLEKTGSTCTQNHKSGDERKIDEKDEQIPINLRTHMISTQHTCTWIDRYVNCQYVPFVVIFYSGDLVRKFSRGQVFVNFVVAKKKLMLTPGVNPLLQN